MAGPPPIDGVQPYSRTWLCWVRETGTVVEEDQEWSNDDPFPRTLETSLTNMAIIQPEPDGPQRAPAPGG